MKEKIEITEEAKREIVAARLSGLADKAYNAYQLEWMKRHGYSLDDFVYYLQCANDDAMDNFGDGLEVDDMFKAVKESGFDSSEMWACKDEFISNEFQDADWMRACLDDDDFKEWESDMNFLKGAEK